MTIDMDWEQEAIAEVRRESPNLADSTASASDPEAARWAKNILVWTTYLPYDCVESMINMGWHNST
jgi:hypothetical protein